MNSRLVALDGLRGIAAVAVMIYHLCLTQSRPWFGYGYLAVDLFFLLSGFVLARTYEHRMSTGLSAVAYIGRRLVRLYPMILAGIALALALHLAAGSRMGIWELAAFQILMIPQITGRLFPLNNVQWSLFFELAANLAHATFFKRLTPRSLAAVIGISGVALVAFIIRDGNAKGGYSFETLEVGAARVAFSFFLGVAIYRMSAAGVLKAPPTPFPVWALVLAGGLGMPKVASPAADIVAILVVFPVMVASCVQSPEPRILRGLCSWWGGLSYPLYSLHWPLLIAMTPMLQDYAAPATYKVTAIALFLFLSISGAFLADRLIERPVIARMRPRSAAPAR